MDADVGIVDRGNMCREGSEDVVMGVDVGSIEGSLQSMVSILLSICAISRSTLLVASPVCTGVNVVDGGAVDNEMMS